MQENEVCFVERKNKTPCEKPLSKPCLCFRSGACVRHVQAVLWSWATARVATLHLQVGLMGALSKWTFQRNFSVLILFRLGTWYSLSAGQKVNPHIHVLRFVNYETNKTLLLAAFWKRSITCLRKLCRDVSALQQVMRNQRSGLPPSILHTEEGERSDFQEDFCIKCTFLESDKA